MSPKTKPGNPDICLWRTRWRADRPSIAPRLGRLTVAGVLAVTLMLLAWPAAAPAQTTPQAKEWYMKFYYSKGLPKVVGKEEPGIAVMVSVGPEWIVGKRGESANF